MTGRQKPPLRQVTGRQRLSLHPGVMLPQTSERKKVQTSERKKAQTSEKKKMKTSEKKKTKISEKKKMKTLRILICQTQVSNL